MSARYVGDRFAAVPAKPLPVREFPLLPLGKRVELHPACDDWMRGDRFGTVTGHSRLRECLDSVTGERYMARLVYVTLDRSGRRKRFHPENIMVQS